MLVLLALTALAAPPVAVLELFTSEGCSSCPPADALMAALEARGRADGTVLVPLSFHVDYWDRLGWADPYGSALWTARQRGYAASLGEDGLYTPQLVVNGTTAMVGSRAAEVEAAVAKALATPAAVAVGLTVRAGDELAVAWTVDAVPVADSLLRLAVVADRVASEVARGENAGRTLPHVNVVRALHTVRLTSTAGSVELPLPEGLTAEHARVVAYVQDTDSFAVIGAAVATPEG